MSRLRCCQSNGYTWYGARRSLNPGAQGEGSGARWRTVLDAARGAFFTRPPFSSLAHKLGPHTGQHRVGKAPPDQVHQD